MMTIDQSRAAHRWLFAAALLVVNAPTEATAAEATGTPRIVEVRVGLANHYKVGHWTPVWVEVEGADRLAAPRVEVTVADSDGVATTSSTALTPAPAERPQLALVYTRVGRAGAALRVSLVEDNRAVHELTIEPRTRTSEVVELPAAGELIVVLGSAPIGMSEAFTDRLATVDQAARRLVRVESIADLPVDWFGYEGVSVLVLSSADEKLLLDWAADQRRHAALVQWVERGGRAVLLCGGERAERLLANGGPLAALAPGTFDEVVRLPETASLELFARSDAVIPGRGIRPPILTARLENLDGQIEVYSGRRPTDWPLVVRGPRGLGEVTFAAVDVSQPPLADWLGRSAFLQALVQPYLTEFDISEAPQTLVTHGYNDLSGALRQRLGQSFAGVAPVSFPLVAALAIAYLLVLGPLDYLVVHRWLRRPWLAWLTLPVAVMVFGMAAMAVANIRNGSAAARVNSVELVDFDMSTGQARGTFWAALYSPRASRFDVALDVALRGATAEDAEVLLSWWGLPGAGIGGMQAGTTDLGIGREAYDYGTQLDALHGVPVLTSATKSLLARWTAPVGRVLDAELSDHDGMVGGTIVNRTGQPLRNMRLFYNGWAYRLGSVESGQQIDIGAAASPRMLKTIVTQDALATAAPGRTERQLFVAHEASAAEILNLMMFYEAAGGVGFAKLPHQVQAYADWSRLIGLGRAILVADVPDQGSRLVDSAGGDPLGEVDQAAVVYRFLLPIAEDKLDG